MSKNCGKRRLDAKEFTMPINSRAFCWRAVEIDPPQYAFILGPEQERDSMGPGAPCDLVIEISTRSAKHRWTHDKGKTDSRCEICRHRGCNISTNNLISSVSTELCRKITSSSWFWSLLMPMPIWQLKPQCGPQISSIPTISNINRPCAILSFLYANNYPMTECIAIPNQSWAMIINTCRIQSPFILRHLRRYPAKSYRRHSHSEYGSNPMTEHSISASNMQHLLNRKFRLQTGM